jgi:UDP-N-acetylmuramoyl-L-alanyl-D-glutamate--2,6-diaminopimelate ligase
MMMAPSARPETFGITGTRGKTVVAHALAQVLAVELPCGLVGNIGNGFPGDLKTPDDPGSHARALEETLEDLHARGAKAVAVEISRDVLEQALASGVRFTHAVFTDLIESDPAAAGGSTPSAEAMLRLFKSPGLVWAIVNLDDPFSADLLGALPPGVAVAAFSLACDRAGSDGPRPTRCDIRVDARAVESLPRGLSLHVVCETSSECAEADLAVGLIGSFNVPNLLAVLAVLLARGLPLERAVRELGRIRSVPGQMECFGDARSPLIVVDTARTPTALEKALVNLRGHRPRRLFTVFGCRGECDREMRPLMGAVAEHLSDGLILTDDSPRGEPGEAIIEDILAGVVDRDRVRVKRQRGLAIRTAIALAGIGDAVLVAGKGHETVQDMGELKTRFSDRAQVVEVLREWREGHH